MDTRTATRSTDPPADRAELLRAVPVLAGLDGELLDRLAASSKLVSLDAGEWLFRAGDEAQTAYVLACGRLEVVAEQDGETVLAVLGRGALIGELALLRRARRAASIRARRDSWLMALERDQFETLLHDAPAFGLALTRVMAEQLARTSNSTGISRAPRTIAIVPLDDGAPVRAAAQDLADRLGGSVARMFAPPVDSPHACLTRAEAEHERVVLLAGDPDPSADWTAFCLREADLVVALTTGSARRVWYAHAAALSACELVCVNCPADDELIERLRPSSVRVALDDDGLTDAMSRLARRLCGRSVGVVLSGGGARALAHLGVLQELANADVRIDRIGGVSLGAIIAAMWAQSQSIEALNDICMHSFVEQNPTNDFTLPLVSLIRGRKTARLLSACFGDVRIEELPVPFLCTSTDLVRREVVVHRTGPLVDALMASIAIPGVFPPAQARHGRLLVDGGVLDNLPAGVMNVAGEGPLIAVDVTGAAQTDRSGANGRRSRLTDAIRRAVTGTDARLPRLPDTIVRCVTLASADTVAAARRHADLVIAPEVSGIGLLDWRRLPEMRRAGAEAARRALAANPEVTSRLREQPGSKTPAER